jgi:branched-chain amino acid transport system permease protein
VLPYLRTVGAGLLGGSDLAQRLTERWLLYFGILFVLVVFFFPRGVIGTVRQAAAARRR